MLNKLNRINQEKDIDRFFGVKFKNNRGFNLSSNFIIMKILNKTQGQPRFAFIISNKIDKRATVRNKIKRQLREIARLNIRELNRPADILMIVKIGIKNKEYQEIKADFLDLLKRARLLK